MAYRWSLKVGLIAQSAANKVEKNLRLAVTHVTPAPWPVHKQSTGRLSNHASGPARVNHPCREPAVLTPFERAWQSTIFENAITAEEGIRR
jgi:hypothetical protein